MYKLITISLLCLIIACENSDSNKEDISRFEIEASYNREYHIADSSLNRLPYLKYESVIFKDSIGNSLKFEIREGEIATEEYLEHKKDWEEMTMILYHVYFERKKIFLVNKDFEFDFLFDIYAAPNDANLHTGEVVRDEIEMSVLSNKTYATDGTCEKFDKDLIFQDIINIRTWVSKQYRNQPNSFFDEMDIRGRTFYNFLHYPSYDNAPHELVFNYEIGLISFQDGKGSTWLFDSFE